MILCYNDIIYFEKSFRKVLIHTEKEVYCINTTIIAIEQAINPTYFSKIHQSFIVNLDKIKKVDSLWVYLNFKDTQLPLSRRQRKKVLIQLKS